FVYSLSLCALTSTLFPYTTLFRSKSIRLQHLGFLERVLDDFDRLNGSSLPHVFLKYRLAFLEIGWKLLLVVSELFQGFICLCNGDRKSTRLNSSHLVISYAVFCLK